METHESVAAMVGAYAQRAVGAGHDFSAVCLITAKIP